MPIRHWLVTALLLALVSPAQAQEAKPVKIVRPAGRCILTGLAWPAPWRAGRRQTG